MSLGDKDKETARKKGFVAAAAAGGAAALIITGAAPILGVIALVPAGYLVKDWFTSNPAFGPTRADESCQAEDFTTSHEERNIAKPSRMVSYVAKLEDNIAKRDFAFGKNRSDFASNDHADELRPIHFSFALCPDSLTVAQHGNAVRDRRNLIETVRDVNDPNAATA